MSEEQSIIDDFADDDKVQGNLDFWKFKEEGTVIGLFRRWEKDNYGEHAVIQTENELELHLPNLTALNGKLKAGDVKEGAKVKIVHTGETKSQKSGRSYEDFDIFIKNP